MKIVVALPADENIISASSERAIISVLSEESINRQIICWRQLRIADQSITSMAMQFVISQTAS